MPENVVDGAAPTIRATLAPVSPVMTAGGEARFQITLQSDTGFGLEEAKQRQRTVFAEGGAQLEIALPTELVFLGRLCGSEPGLMKISPKGHSE